MAGLVYTQDSPLPTEPEESEATKKDSDSEVLKQKANLLNIQQLNQVVRRLFMYTVSLAVSRGLCVVLSFVFLAMCNSAKRDAQTVGNSTSSRSTDQSQPTRTFTLDQGEGGAGRLDSPAASSRQSSFLPLAFAVRILPEDFAIGALPGTAGSEDAILGKVDEFIQALARREIKENLLLQERQRLLTSSLTHPLSQIPSITSYRIGRTQILEEGRISARVRLFSTVGVTEGEIYLNHEQSGWLISDVQIDLMHLSKAYRQPESKFYPVGYEWLTSFP
jgi:hypothetical protein